MKKILIVNNNMHIGGVQKALVNLLCNIHDKYEVTLLLFCRQGEYIKDIPEDVKIISVKSGYKYLGMTKYDVKGHPLKLFKRSLYAGITRFFGRGAAIGVMSLFQGKIKGYDVVISYLQNGGDKAFYGGCNDFVIKHTVAKKRIGVLHCDYLKCGANTKKNADQYSRFDAIAACSEGCKSSFASALPELKEKTHVVRNCHDFEKLHSLADMNIPQFPNDRINIVSVARFGREKGMLRGVKAVEHCLEKGIRVNYYMIGDGIEKPMIEEYIRNKGLSENILCLGEMANPYPYMKSADLFLIPSHSEAAPMVIGECAFLSTPILSTETSSAIEMIEDTSYGWVAENDENALAKRLYELLCNGDEIKERARKLSELSHSNKDALAQFEKIIN